jgi:hypothetical protein
MSRMRLEPLYGEEPHRSLCAGTRAARGEISGTPYRLNCCAISIVHIQFKDMAAGPHNTRWRAAGWKPVI